MKLPGVERSTYFGKPALKINGEMIACMPSHKSAEPESLVVRVDFLERDLRIAHEPEVYYVKPHYENYSAVLVRLALIDREALRDLLQSAWRTVTAAAASKRSRRGVSGAASRRRSG